MKKIILISIGLIAHAFASPQLLHTPSGVPVYFEHTPAPKIIDINIIWQAGSAYDGKHFGIAKLTHDLMNSGAANMDASGFNNYITSTGARLSGSVNRSIASWHMRSLTDNKHLTAAMQALHNLINQPNFDAKEIQRYKSMQISAAAEINNSPGRLAAKNLRANLYQGTALAHSILGNKQSIDKIKRADILNFYKKYYVQNNAKIVIVGAITKQRAIQLAARCLSQLAKGQKSQTLPPITPLKSQTIKTINFPSQQAHIILAHIGVTATNPDYYPLMVSNQAFGSGMSSKLFQEVRDKRGLAYSIYSSWKPTPYGGIFLINLQTKVKSAAQAVQLVQTMLKKYKTSTASNKKIQQSKRQIIGKLLLQKSSNAGLLSELTNIAVYNYPLNYYQTFADKIRAVTTKNIQRAKNKYLHPQKMLIIAVKPERVKFDIQ